VVMLPLLAIAAAGIIALPRRITAL
jgi:hypothetical protein